MPGQHRLCRACATERDATAVQRREDDRLKFNGTQAWWITRGYDPVFIAALLVQRDVQPGQVHPRAPKDLRALLSSEVSAPFGEVSKHQGSRRGSPQLVVHCRRPARLRPTTPRLCGSCAAALVARRRSPARGSAHTPAKTTCRGPRARGWCEHRSGTAGGRWEPCLPGQPASSLVPHALVRTAFANSKADRRGLWIRHDDTHPQADTLRSRVRTMRRYGVRHTFSQLVPRQSVLVFRGAGVILVTSPGEPSVRTSSGDDCLLYLSNY